MYGLLIQNSLSLGRDPNYRKPDEFYECRFIEKTAYRSLLSVYTYSENALA